MIQITPTISIDERDIKFEFIRASGPGGQNVNKVATAVQLRFKIAAASLNSDVHERLVKLAGSRLNSAGEIIISSRRFRTQLKNREDALKRLIQLLQKASIAPKIRRKRKLSKADKVLRLQAKRRRSETKGQRRPISISNYVK